MRTYLIGIYVNGRTSTIEELERLLMKYDGKAVEIEKERDALFGRLFRVRIETIEALSHEGLHAEFPELSITGVAEQRFNMGKKHFMIQGTERDF